MTTSGSIDFKLTAQEVVTEARTLLGIHADEEPLSAPELTRGLRWLNIMLKAWQADGVQAWTLTEGSFSLVQGDVDYVFGAGGTVTTLPVDLQQVRITRAGNQIVMTELTRSAYFGLPNRSAQGHPTQYYYDRQQATGVLYVWPAPDAGLGTIEFTGRRRIMDVDDGVNDFDLPQEWFLALTYGLAQMLLPIYGKAGTDRGAFVEKWAPVYYAQVKTFDTSDQMSSISILPDMD